MGIVLNLELTFVGYYHAAWGDLFYMDHPNGNRATVSVDSVGHTWVGVRRIPEGGYFHTERVESWQAYNLAADAERVLREKGFDSKCIAPFAHRVVERGI